MTKRFVSVIICFVFFFSCGVSTITQFQTYEGCNATFVCYHSSGSSVDWTSSRGPLQQGSKVVIETTSYYSVLNLISVSPVDNGNISCERNQSKDLYFSLSVQRKEECKDLFNTITCQGTIDGGDDCTNNWMRTNCKKSCGLCQKYICTQPEQPTAPPTVPSTTVPLTTIPSTTVPSTATTSSELPTSARTNKTEANHYNSSTSSRSNINSVILTAILLVIIISTQVL